MTSTSSADERGGQGSDHEGSKPSDKSKPSRTRQKSQTFDFKTDGANVTLLSLHTMFFLAVCFIDSLNDTH